MTNKEENKETSRLQRISKLYRAFEKNIEFDYINWHFDVILPNLKGPKILEVGCSIGIMTRRLFKIFPKLTVVEGYKELIDYVKRLTKAKNINFIVSLFEYFKTDEKFNDIILANVLEHVKNPVSILKKARNLLESNGRIHIIVPNAGSLHRRIGQKMGILKEPTSFSENDRRIGHRRVYTKEMLKHDIQKAGLRLIKDQGIFLKPFSDSQMKKLDKKILNALFEIGKELQDYCSVIYFICNKK